MKKSYEYIQILLNYALNVQNGDRLLVCLPNTQKDFAWQLEQMARDMGAVDVDVCYHNLVRSFDRIYNALGNDFKFLFFTSENDDSKYMKMVRDFISNYPDASFTVAVLPSKKWAYKAICKDASSYGILEDILYHYSSIDGVDPFADWSNITIDSDRKVGKIKNLKVNRFLVSDLQDTDLSFEFTDQVKGIFDGYKIKFFPNYKFDILPVPHTMNGYITSFKDISVDGVRISDLRLCVSNGKIIDYDCTSGFEVAKQLFQTSHPAYVKSVGLVDCSVPLYSAYGEIDNFVLDRTSTSSIEVMCYDEVKQHYREVMIPIGSETLRVFGMDDYDKANLIYAHQEFQKKLFK